MAKVVIGVLGSDVHAVGNTIMQRVLETNGVEVVNIGVLSSQEDFINAAIETGADALLVSSLYGHGEIDCMGFKEKMIESNLEHVKMFIGGNIVVGKQDEATVIERFEKMGFDKAYGPGVQIMDVLDEILKMIK